MSRGPTGAQGLTGNTGSTGPAGDTTQLVPYSGASSNVNLGVRTLSSGPLTATGSFSLASNQFSYQEAGVYLHELTACKLLLPWHTSPATGAFELDLSGLSHTGTYAGTWAATDQVNQGLTWTVSPNGTNCVVTMADSDDFSFGNAVTDTAFSVGGWVQVPSVVAEINIIGKWDATTGAEVREWTLDLTTTRAARLYMFDESLNVQCFRTQTTAPSIGWHHLVATYDPTLGATGTAANGVTLYQDGLVTASTATNNANYVAMENLSSLARIGANMGASALQNLYTGDIGKLFITKETLSAATIWRMYIETRGFYNL